MRNYIFLTLVSLFLFSCLNKSDYDLHSAEVNPVLTLPLVSGDLVFLDVLNKTDSAFIHVAPDSLIYLEYFSSLKSTTLRDQFKISDNEIDQSFVLPVGIIPAHTSEIRTDSISELIDFKLSPEQLTLIDFKTGGLAYSAQLLPDYSNLPFGVEISSPDFISKTTGKTLSILAGNNSLDLSDYKVKLNKNRFSLKLVLILRSSPRPVTITPNTSVATRLTLHDMDFNLLEGFLGDRTVSLPDALLSVGAFGESLHNANVSFAQPFVAVNIVNDYGVPTQVDFVTLEARKDGASLPATLNPANPINILSPTTVGKSATTSVTVLNAKQLLDFGPTRFFYSVNARINNGLTAGNNFLSDTAKLSVNLNVKIPLYGQVSKVPLADTVALDLGKVNQSQINSALLNVDVTNQLPMDAKIQFYLLDSKYAMLDSLLLPSQTNLIKGSVVTASGDLQSAGQISEQLPLDNKALNTLFVAKYIVIKAVMNTSKDASGNSVDVKFKSGYKLKVNLGLRADLKFNITF